MEPRKTPKAFKVKDRDLFGAMGIDPATLRRRPYYAATPEIASQRALESYGPTEPILTLFTYYATTYLPTIVHRSANWQSQVGWAMDRYVLPAFGETPIRDIKRPALQAFFNSLQGTLAVSSIQRVRIVFSGVLNLAVADERIGVNPLPFVKLPSQQEPDKIALTYEQLAKLYLASPKRLQRMLVLCCFAGGLRIGEACATTKLHLTADDVLHVRQQVLQIKGGATLTKKLKTPQTRRDIPLPEGMADALRGSEGVYILSTNRRGYALPNNIARELDEAIETAEVPRITPHECRHTFISLLENELEAPAAVVAALAGKKDRRVTSGYSHTQRAQMKRWLKTHWERFQQAIEAERATMSARQVGESPA